MRRDRCSPPVAPPLAAAEPHRPPGPGAGPECGGRARSQPRASEPEAADRALVGRVAAGDRAAFSELYRRYAGRLGGFVWKLLRRDDGVEEVVDDALLVVWNKAASFDGERRFSTWLFGIAHNLALQRLSRSRREQRDHRLFEQQPDALGFPPPSDPVLHLESRAALAELREAVEKLSPEHRCVVELTFFEGCSYAEIARITSSPVGTVKTRMFHARRQLARSLSRSPSP